jgi:hypothetical protein
MDDFGFLKSEDIKLDDFFEENNKETKNKKDTIICPYCNKEIEI